MNQTVPLADLDGKHNTLDLDRDTDVLEWDLSKVDNLYLTLRTSGFAGTWPTGTVPVLTLTLSADGLTFETPTGGAVTYNTAGAKAAVPVRGYRRGRLAVTSAGSASGALCFVGAAGSLLGA